MRINRVMPSFCLFLLFTTLSYGADPAMFRGNPQHSGVYAATGISAFNGVKWKFHTGGMMIGSPTLADGTVYAGSADGNFYAVDAGSGVLKWKFEVRSRIPAT